MFQTHNNNKKTTKKPPQNSVKCSKLKKKKKVWFTKPYSPTFAIFWMIMLNSLTPRFEGKALGPGEVQGVPAVTDLSANTKSPRLVKSKSTERSGGM